MPDTKTRPGRATPEAPVRLNRTLFFAACEAHQSKACTDEARAALFGTSRRALTRYLDGESVPLLTTARRIAKELNVSVDDLWPAA